MPKEPREMHPQAKEGLIEELVAIAKDIADPTSGGGHTIIYQSLEITLDVSDSLYDKCNAIADSILKANNWEDAVSKEYMLSAVQQLMAMVLKGNSITAEQVGLHFERLLADATAAIQDRVVYIPLVGIALDEGEFALGNVTLTSVTEEEFEQLATSLQLTVEQLKAPIKTAVVGTVCAKFHVRAEPTRAQERGLTECRIVLDLLRYALPAIASEKFKIRIGIAGEVSRGRQNRSAWIVASDHSQHTYSASAISLGLPLRINQDNTEVMREIRVFELAEIVKQATKTKFEEAVLDAVHWFANAQMEMEEQYKLLSMIIALETLFTPDGGEPIRATIAEGVAFVIGSDSTERKRIRSHVSRLYSSRSEVAHGRGRSVLAVDIEFLMETTQEVLIQLTERRNEFMSKENLATWILDRKMA